ncbi:hypothetical protein [Streptomyces sp. NPDC048196]
MAEACGRRESIQLMAERLPDGNMRAAAATADVHRYGRRVANVREKW